MRILLPLLALSACGSSSASTDMHPSTRSFAVPGAFDAVTLAGPDNVRVVTGSAPSITATGRSADLDRIEIELKGSNLVVTRNGDGVMHWGWHGGDNDVKITVTTPKPITGASLVGSGDLNVDQGGGDTFAAELKGSGDLTVTKIMAKAAKLSLAGSGDLKVGGQAKTTDVELAGSGGVDAAGLIAETAQIELRGSGDVDAHATRSANVVLKGSGDVTIKGTGNCTSDKRGSGEVHCAP